MQPTSELSSPVEPENTDQTKRQYKLKLMKRQLNFSLSHLVLFVLVFGTIGGILIWSSYAASPNLTPQESATGEARLVLRFKTNATKAQRDNIIKNENLNVIKEIPQIGVKVVTVPAVAQTAVLNALSHNPAVDFAEQDKTLKPQEQLPNDPFFLNSGTWSIASGAWGWYATHVTQAWDITLGSPNTQIAILDTGLKTAGLTDFSGQISSTWNVLNSSTDVTSNAGNHGTYTAGVAGLAISNGVGSAGYCPKCQLMIIQVGTDTSAYLSDIASGLTYATDHGAKIANMSWAGTSDSSTLQNAINYAHAKGLVMFAAAGNSNCDCKTFPAGDQNVLGVAGVSSAAGYGNKENDSNYGTWVQIAAPENNYTAWPIINGQPGYAPVGGTSMASPAAAAIAGLLFSYNSALTNTQVEQALENTSAPVNFTIAHGRVDALAALQSLGATDPQPSSAPTKAAASQLYYEINGSKYTLSPLTAAPRVGQVLVRGIGGWTGTAGLTVAGLQWQRCDSIGNNCANLTTSGTYTLQSADAGSTIKLVFNVQNSIGTVPQSVLSGVVGASSTPAPTVSLSASPATITAGQSSTLTWNSANATSCTASGAWSGNQATSGSTLVSPTANSTYVLTCTGTGGSASASTSIIVSPAATPPATPTGLAPTPSNSSVILTWNANTETDLAGYNLQWKPTNGSAWTLVTNITGLTYTQSGLINGTSYDFQLQAVNTARQTSAWTATISAIPVAPLADTVAPTVTISAPADGSSIASQRKVAISASATDNNVVIKMELYIDGQLKTTVTTPNLSYTWSINKTVKSGSHTITVKAYDPAGNVGQSSVTVTK